MDANRCREIKCDFLNLDKDECTSKKSAVENISSCSILDRAEVKDTAHMCVKACRKVKCGYLTNKKKCSKLVKEASISAVTGVCYIFLQRAERLGMTLLEPAKCEAVKCGHIEGTMCGEQNKPTSLIDKCRKVKFQWKITKKDGLNSATDTWEIIEEEDDDEDDVKMADNLTEEEVDKLNEDRLKKWIEMTEQVITEEE